MKAITAQFLHQHKDKVVYQSDVVIGSMVLTTDVPLHISSVSKLSFRLPLFPPQYRCWMWKWLNGRMHVEMLTKREIRLSLMGSRNYIFEPTLIIARINQSDVATQGILWIDVDCYLDTRQTRALSKIFSK